MNKAVTFYTCTPSFVQVFLNKRENSEDLAGSSRLRLSGNVCSDGGGCIYRSRFFVLGLQIGHLHFGIDFGSGSSLLSLLFSRRFCHGSLFGFWFLGSGSLKERAYEIFERLDTSAGALSAGADSLDSVGAGADSSGAGADSVAGSAGAASSLADSADSGWAGADDCSWAGSAAGAATEMSSLLNATVRIRCHTLYGDNKGRDLVKRRDSVQKGVIYQENHLSA